MPGDQLSNQSTSAQVPEPELDWTFDEETSLMVHENSGNHECDICTEWLHHCEEYYSSPSMTRSFQKRERHFNQHSGYRQQITEIRKVVKELQDLGESHVPRPSPCPRQAHVCTQANFVASASALRTHTGDIPASTPAIDQRPIKSECQE